MNNILLTGGAGYIGSHMVNLLLENDYEPIILENFSNSSSKNIENLEKKFNKKIQVINADLREDISNVVLDNIDTVIHFAALKAVGDSVKEPLKYYENNVFGTLNLLKLMEKNNIKKLIFSSTAAVYGSSEEPVTEANIPTPESPYGWSKLMSEQIIKDNSKSHGISAVVLRYFNVAGNEESGLIGEESKDPKNLIPALLMSYLGYKEMKLQVYGDDYPTRDGSCIRDYIHVLDLVDAHLKSIKYLETHEGVSTFNLGTGEGTSVLEIINALEKVTGDKLDYDIVARRPGDPAIVITNPKKAQNELGWKAKHNVEEMISSSLKWYKGNFKQ